VNDGVRTEASRAQRGQLDRVAQHRGEASSALLVTATLLPAQQCGGVLQSLAGLP